MASILDFFRRKPQVKSNQEARNYGSALYGNTGFNGTVSNQAVSKETSLRLSTVWSCVKVISETIASISESGDSGINLYFKATSPIHI